MYIQRSLYNVTMGDASVLKNKLNNAWSDQHCHLCAYYSGILLQWDASEFVECRKHNQEEGDGGG